jgi:hypothetical protein
MPYIGKEPVVGNFVKLDAITTSATATFALTQSSAAFTPESANQMIVSLNGVIQAPGTAFTLSGSNIVFASALTSSDVIDFILVLGSVLDVGTPSDDTVSTAKLKSNAVTAAKIAPATITTSQIAPATIASSNIAPATIAASNIAPATITTTQIAPNTVAASNIAPGTITTSEISPTVTLGIPKVGSDPSPLTPSNIGDVFFNTSTEQLKIVQTQAAGWTAEANAPTAHVQAAAAGTASAAVLTLIYGGSPGSLGYLTGSNASLDYNGTSWSSGPAFNPGYAFGAGTGTESAGLAFGGWDPFQTATGEYNGSSWSSGGALSSGRYSHSSAGTQSSGMAIAGRGPPESVISGVEEYNGTSWSSGTSIPAAERDHFGGGASNASAWIARGTSVHFSWDDSSWSAETNNPVNQVGGGSGNSGPVNDHILVGTQAPTYINNCQVWDGTSWSAYTNYPIATGNGASMFNGGATTGGMVSGGHGPPAPAYTNLSNAKTAAGAVANIITIS